MCLMNRDWVVFNGLYVRATGVVIFVDALAQYEAKVRIRIVAWKGYQLDVVGEASCDVTPVRLWRNVAASVRRTLIMRCMWRIKAGRAEALARQFAGLDNG